MLETVEKYVIFPPGSDLSMPAGTKILGAGIEDGRICIWALVEDVKIFYHQKRCIRTYGTGDPIQPGHYIGTVNWDGYVYHIFEHVIKS